MNEIEDAGPPISGDPYVQNRKLLSLLRETITRLDNGPDLTNRLTHEDMVPAYRDFTYGTADWLEAEVSIAIT